MIKSCLKILRKIYHRYKLRKYKHVAFSAKIAPNCIVYNRDNLVMGEQTSINNHSVILNTRAKFVMKKWSGAAVGLIVVTGNHMSIVGMNKRQVTDQIKDMYDTNHMYDRDVIVDEDVWIGARVTILCGAHIGRGAIIGAGSVVTRDVMPYSIVAGNPAKHIRYRFSKEDIITHEESLYPVSERLPHKIIESLC